jgi:hypothetical protein
MEATAVQAVLVAVDHKEAVPHIIPVGQLVV